MELSLFLLLSDALPPARKRAHADAEYYTIEREAESNKLLLTAEYLELKRLQAIASNNKIFYGEKIPSMFLTGSPPERNVEAK